MIANDPSCQNTCPVMYRRIGSLKRILLNLGALQIHVDFTARNGSIQLINTKIIGDGNKETNIESFTMDRKMHEINNWETLPELRSQDSTIGSVWKWLNELFGQR